jgi:subtilisin family serine protease
MMPEIISVGGVTVDADEGIKAWKGGSSFKSTIFAGRDVPDLCGVASEMALPVSPESDPGGDGWDTSEGATSAAAPQVAGVIALLLQKNESLSPQQIKTILCNSARDVRHGSSFTKAAAKVGKDPATGAGLVDAFKAWQSV